MAMYFRKTSGQILSQIVKNAPKSQLIVRSAVTLKIEKATPPPNLSYDEKNMMLKRPQSPHLSIYAPQMTSMLSITHRATGLALTSYFMAIGYGTMILPESIPHYIEILENAKIGSVPFIILRLILGYPLCYHFWNGIRHLMWDMGMMLKIKEIYLTGYVMLVLAAISSVILAALPLLGSKDDDE